MLNKKILLVDDESKDDQHSVLKRLIKDSYANSFIPFLIQHYEKVHVIDPRFYKDSSQEYIRSNDSIRDLLFLYNMNTIDSDIGILTIK